MVCVCVCVCTHATQPNTDGCVCVSVLPLSLFQLASRVLPVVLQRCHASVFPRLPLCLRLPTLFHFRAENDTDGMNECN